MPGPAFATMGPGGAPAAVEAQRSAVTATPDIDIDADEFAFLAEIAREQGAPPPERPRRVDAAVADGSRISGIAWGDAPRATFLHGAGLNAHTFDTTLLLAGLPALALDLPGHGDSSWRGDADYSPRALAPAVAAALDALATAPQVLVGHSLGGLTALAVAAARPDLVGAVILVDILPGLDPSAGGAHIREFFAGPDSFADRDELLARARAFGLGGAGASARRGVWLNSRRRPDGRIVWKHHFAHLASAAGAAGGDAARGSAAELTPASGWDDLAATAAPVTVLAATRGFLATPAGAESLARLRRDHPRVRVDTIDAVHNVQEDAAAALGDRVRAVVDALPPAP